MIKKLTKLAVAAAMLFSSSGTVLAEEITDETEEIIVESENIPGEAEINDDTELPEIPDDPEPGDDPEPEPFPYEDGVTVEQDDESPTGYTANFAFTAEDSEEHGKVTKVELSTGFKLVPKGGEGEAEEHTAYEYVNGDFTTHQHPAYREGDSDTAGQSRGAGIRYDMTYNSPTGRYVISIPIPSGVHTYSYVITYEDGRSVTTDDPANPARAREQTDGDNAYDLNNSIVYGKYDPVKQSESLNLDFFTPYEGEEHGKLEYVKYEGVTGNMQDLGIFTPAGYDPEREEPYRVIYAFPGMGGNEVHWFAIEQSDNMMDRISAENPDKEAMIVTVDAQKIGWNYENIAKDVLEYAIPYVEENYNVSADPEDRAVCGLSMGAFTTVYFAFHYPEEFGYFGAFSGTNMANVTYKEGFEYDNNRLRVNNTNTYADAMAYLEEVLANIEAPEALKESVLYLTAGVCDNKINKTNNKIYENVDGLLAWAEENLPEGHIYGDLLCGSHDVYTWGQSIWKFMNEICWTLEKPEPFRFEDVQDPEKYYYDPVYWAYFHKPQITTGTTQEPPYLFSPNDDVTRGQMVTFLWRLAGEPKASTPASFADVKPERYFYEAVSWAAEQGITTGYADGTNRFGPDDKCTREQIVTFLWRAAGSPKPETVTDFVDVQAGRYFADSVSWAAEKGITVGLNDGTNRFGVGMSCTRGMAVTFLYRYDKN